ncbi:MAG TPA: glycosyltransferase family 9 protein [Terriglobia bacterium]|nr:glycosyltransferase family 9 protein [Terriglobia bacterium]
MRLLLIIPGAIGDFILTLPSVVWIRQKLEPEWLEIWAERSNLELAQVTARADQTRALADTGIDSWPPSSTLYANLKAFDTVISWRGAQHIEFRKLLEQHHPNVYFLPKVPDDCPVHAMDYRRSQVEALLGADRRFPPYPEIYPTEDGRVFARRFLAVELASNLPIAMIHPGASGIQKRWPATSFAELAGRLLAQGWQILLCEGPLDRIAVGDFFAALQSNEHATSVRNIKVNSLMDLAAILSFCSLFVGNDSGISHLSAGTGCPTLVVFTATNPAIWAPRGPRVAVIVAPMPDQALTSITKLYRDSITPT